MINLIRSKILVIFSFSISFIFFNLNSSMAHNPISTNKTTFLIKNVKIHLGDGTFIENGHIGIKQGIIDLVASKLPDNIDKIYSEIIEGKEMHAYPSFIALSNKIGLVEVEGVRATRDDKETGHWNSNIEAHFAFNAESKLIETTRMNGILINQTRPYGGNVSGKSSVFYMDGWNFEDSLLRKGDGIHIYWPEKMKMSGHWTDSNRSFKVNKHYDQTVFQLETFFNLASSFVKDKYHADKDLHLEALRGVFKGQENLYIHVNGSYEINHVLNFFKKFHISKITLVSCMGPDSVIEKIVESKVSIILAHPHNLPSYSHEDIDTVYKMASTLYKNKILFSIDSGSSLYDARNVPFNAGSTVAYGLPYEEAVKMITLNAAKILGIDHKVGSIKKGLEATFFISQGDALDMKSNQLVYAFIKGKSLDLKSNHHIKLYEKYMKKHNLSLFQP